MNILLMKRIIAIISIAILALNMLFLALRMYSPLTFWIILAITAIVSLVAMKVLK